MCLCHLEARLIHVMFVAWYMIGCLESDPWHVCDGLRICGARVIPVCTSFWNPELVSTAYIFRFQQLVKINNKKTSEKQKFTSIRAVLAITTSPVHSTQNWTWADVCRTLSAMGVSCLWWRCARGDLP